jgi:hypothetical protein
MFVELAGATSPIALDTLQLQSDQYQVVRDGALGDVRKVVVHDGHKGPKEITVAIEPEIYPHVGDEATVILTYPKAQAILQASWNCPFDRKDIEVYGATGEAITVFQSRT